MLANENNANNEEKTLVYTLLVLVFVVSAAILSIFSVVKYNNEYSRYTLYLEAKVVDVVKADVTETHIDRTDVDLYNKVEYEYDDIKYTEKSVESKQDTKKEGDTIEIMVNPDNPVEFIEASTVNERLVLTVAVISVATLAVIVLSFFTIQSVTSSRKEDIWWKKGKPSEVLSLFQVLSQY